MESKIHIESALNSGIAFLSDHQFHHGEFCTYMGEGEYLEKWCIPDSATFSTAVICTCLLPLRGNTLVEAMFVKSADFLKFQMMRGGTWNFFTVWHKLFPLCPADLDSTSCSSYFLKQIDYSFPDNRGLVLANRNRKGLFYTWFTLRWNHIVSPPKSATHWMLLLRGCKHPIRTLLFWLKGHCEKTDVDAVVNANVLLYMGGDERMQPVVDYLAGVIETDRERTSDKWYRNPLEFYYAIARNYAAGIEGFERTRPAIIEKIQSMVQPDGCIGHSPADTAMAVISLIQLGHSGRELADGVRYLVQEQAANGSWKRQALCYGGTTIVWGSEELSTALCLEALARYNLLVSESEKRSAEDAIHQPA